MKPSMTTDALHTLIRGALAGYTQMGAPALKLMWAFVAIEIVLIGIWAAFGEKQLASLFKELLGLGIWIWIVQAFPRLAQALVESLATAALRAGGGGDDFSVMLDPSSIMARGLQVTEPFAAFIQAIPTLNVGDKIIYSLCYLAIVWMYIWMAWCLFYPVIEYYIFVVIGSVLMPFAINKHTRFIADRAINMVVGCGIKLMVLGFCLAIIQPVLSQIRFTNPVTWNQLFSIMLAVGALGYLLYKAPQAAMSMVQGSPSINGSEILAGVGRVGFGVVASGPIAAGRFLTGATAERVGAGSALAASRVAGGGSGSSSAATVVGGAAVAAHPTSGGGGAANAPKVQPPKKGPDA